eukprot:tig00020725_g13529.t1
MASGIPTTIEDGELGLLSSAGRLRRRVFSDARAELEFSVPEGEPVKLPIRCERVQVTDKSLVMALREPVLIALSPNRPPAKLETLQIPLEAIDKQDLKRPLFRKDHLVLDVAAEGRRFTARLHAGKDCVALADDILSASYVVHCASAFGCTDCAAPEPGPVSLPPQVPLERLRDRLAASPAPPSSSFCAPTSCAPGSSCSRLAASPAPPSSSPPLLLLRPVILRPRLLLRGGAFPRGPAAIVEPERPGSVLIPHDACCPAVLSDTDAELAERARRFVETVKALRGVREARAIDDTLRSLAAPRRL